MKLAIVCFPSLGGSSVIASELAVGLAGRGHRVHLVMGGSPSRALPLSSELSVEEVHAPSYPLFEHAPYTLALTSRLVELTRRDGVDLIHVHYAVPHAASAILAKQVLGGGVKVVTSLHGTDVTRVGPDPAYRPVTAWAIAASDGVTAPSAFLRDEARRGLGVPEDTAIEVIPNFVDTAHFAPPATRDRGVLDALFGAPGGPVLFHVSNFREVKRPGDLLEVLVRVRQHTPARLVLVGDGPERAALEGKAAFLGLAPWVKFLGKRQDFAHLLGHADLFLLPSESESFGVAALEALSCGVPVLAYRVGGLPEVIANGCGTLVAPFDVDALAAAALELLTGPDRRDAMGRAARARAVERYRIEPALDRFEAYLSEVLS